MRDIEEGKKPKSRRSSRLQRHISTALAFVGDRPEWVSAFLQEFRQLFGTEPGNKCNSRRKFDIQEPEEVYVKEGRCVRPVTKSFL
jgi:hypothetical protein